MRQASAASYGPGTLLVAGPGAVAPQGLAQAVEQGMDVVCMGLGGGELKAWCPVSVATAATNVCFSRIERLPPELNGLCNADWAWHGRMQFDALATTQADRDGSSPALRVIRRSSPFLGPRLRGARRRCVCGLCNVRAIVQSSQSPLKPLMVVLGLFMKPAFKHLPSAASAELPLDRVDGDLNLPVGRGKRDGHPVGQTRCRK